MSNGSRYIFPIVITFSALSISLSAAFYSITGLSKLFAGAQSQVIIMASALEISKLVIASFLYRYWRKTNFLLKSYLTAALLILIVITSIGIYGFLSSAYQEVSSKVYIVENKRKYLENTKALLELNISQYDTQLTQINQRISNFSQAKATQIQIKDNTSPSGVRTTISTAELRLAQQQLQIEQQQLHRVQTQKNILNDSLQNIQLQVLSLENELNTTAELGPLRYLSNVTNYSMDQITNYLILVIICVFDPLAICLVIVANFTFKQLKNNQNMSTKKGTESKKTKVQTNKQVTFGTINQQDVSEVQQKEQELVAELDELEENTLLDKPEIEKVNNFEVVEPQEVKPVEQPKQTMLGKIVKRVLQKGPSFYKVLFEDGSVEKVHKSKVRK